MTSELLAFVVPNICKLKAATLIISLSDDGICGVDFGSGDVVVAGSGCFPVMSGCSSCKTAKE